MIIPILGNNVRVLSNKVTRTVRCLSISDIQLYAYAKQKSVFDAILDLVYRYMPDYLFISGDSLDDARIVFDKETMESYIDFLKKVTPITNVYAIKGNHDNMTRGTNGQWIKSDKESNAKFNYYFDGGIPNFTLLRNQKIDIPKDGLSISGLEEEFEWYEGKGEKPLTFINHLKRFIATNNFTNTENLCLFHSNNGLFDKSNHLFSKNIIGDMPFSLFDCGHKHGGLLKDWCGEGIATMVGSAIKPDFKENHRGIAAPQKRWFDGQCYGTYYGTGEDEINTTVVTSTGITKLPPSTGILSTARGLYHPSFDIITIEQVSLSTVENLLRIYRNMLEKIQASNYRPSEKALEHQKEEAIEEYNSLNPEEKVFIKRLEKAA